MKKIRSILICLLIPYVVFSHAGKSSYHVIIDSDCAIDDFRAITLCLASYDMRVLAITTSNGSLPAQEGAQKVNSLLSDLHHEGIPVGYSSRKDISAPVWRQFSQSLQWGMSTRVLIQPRSSQEVIEQAFSHCSQNITLLAFGSLSTYAELLVRKPEYASRIEKIVWYNEKRLKSGYNYELDTAAYTRIQSFDVPIHIVSLTRDDAICTPAYISNFQHARSRYSAQIYSSCSSSLVQDRMKKHKLFLWDDLIPLYVTNPILFEVEMVQKNLANVSLLSSLPIDLVHNTLFSIYESGENPESQLFAEFPTNKDLYVPQYARILDSTIAAFGLNEWKAMVLTNEIHGHIGIYSIIGAKIGVRACEFFNVGANNIEIVSYAGTRPPLSCFNDGVQISTGATIGQGLIDISDTVYNIPTILSRCNGFTVEFTVKEDVAMQMKSDIKKGVRLYGNLTPAYWNYIEDLARLYWTKFNRYEIFDMNIQ
ncbi:MAG: nucleoside hydrolase [Bacteroidales bacterium]|jgi:inosine-uridine nucleoside N-ribohydrolase|nr:nucleoside hydrolase [Bacteroidales bacterium]